MKFSSPLELHVILKTLKAFILHTEYFLPVLEKGYHCDASISELLVRVPTQLKFQRHCLAEDHLDQVYSLKLKMHFRFHQNLSLLRLI